MLRRNNINTDFDVNSNYSQNESKIMINDISNKISKEEIRKMFKDCGEIR